MKIQTIIAHRFKILFNRKISVSGHSFTEKDALRLEVITNIGTSISEVSVLKDFHSVGLLDCLDAYKENYNDFKNFPAQIKFPIEMALFKLIQKNLSSGGILINGYYDPSLMERPPFMECLKLKIGRSTPQDDLQQIKILKSKLLRLDANKALDEATFKEYLKNVQHYDYFEEPFTDPALMHKFPQARFALDESVEDMCLQELPQVTTFVLKPSILGLDKTLELINLAKKLNKSVVISSTFEGELGLLGLCKLALYTDQKLGRKNIHGLGTISFLKAKLEVLRIQSLDKQTLISF